MMSEQRTRDERIYQLCLLAYPSSFRQSYQREMLLVFRDQRRDGVTQHAGYWISMISDIARNALREWKDELTTHFQSGERQMKGMAIVAVIVAAFELINTSAEIQAGGFAGRDLLSQLSLALVLVCALGLLIAGVSLLRRGQAAVPFARMAAVGCLASFALIGLTRPVLSGLGMLVGVGFPITLLIFLFINQGRGPANAARM